MPLETITAPLPGKIINISVNLGDEVAEGAEICTIESMKMENPILSPVLGIVKEIKVASEQTLKIGDVIAVIEY